MFGGAGRGGGDVSSVVAIVAVAILQVGCLTTPISSRTKSGIDRIAVIVLVDSPGQVRVGSALGALAEAEDVDSLVAERLANLVSPYAIEQSVRRAVIDSMARPAPWRVAAPLEVASALGALLSREEKPRYERLSTIDVDAVLEVRVIDWGIAARDASTGGFMRMDARLVRLGNRERVVWRGKASVDRLRSGGVPGVEAASIIDQDEALVAVIADLAAAAGARLSTVMGLAEN